MEMNVRFIQLHNPPVTFHMDPSHPAFQALRTELGVVLHQLETSEEAALSRKIEIQLEVCISKDKTC